MIRVKLNRLLEALESGKKLLLISGHTVVWSKEHDAPAFQMWRYRNYQLPTEVTMGVDSDDLWVILIETARKDESEWKLE